jgi:hypothetical protein
MANRDVELIRIRHGELDICEMLAAPDLTGYDAEPANNGRLIVGHSESGAHHTLVAEKATLYRKKGTEIAFLILNGPGELVHEGARHKTTSLPARTFRVVTKRQANEDESWSPVVD